MVLLFLCSNKILGWGLIFLNRFPYYCKPYDKTQTVRRSAHVSDNDTTY
jgi:hypothetical protein